MKRFLSLLLAMLTLALLVTGCGNDADSDPGADAGQEDSVTEYHNPLTGEVSDTDLRTARPCCVMINNIQVAQPQCGISDADLIYEMLVEGNYTRMMAVFSDIADADVLGSMRSVRPYYAQIALSYDAILVHAGGSDQAYADIEDCGIDNIDGVRGTYADTVFYRDPDRMSAGYEHSLFTTGENIADHIASAEIRTEHDNAMTYGLSFAEDAVPADGEDAAAVAVAFTNRKTTKFSYNEDDGTYTASQFNSTYVDGNTGTAPAFANILILESDTRVVDDAGRREMDLNANGDGYFVCGGKAVPIQWSHKAGEDFSYTLADGSPLQLGIGKTYVCIIPSSGSSVSFQ